MVYHSTLQAQDKETAEAIIRAIEAITNMRIVSFTIANGMCTIAYEYEGDDSDTNIDDDEYDPTSDTDTPDYYWLDSEEI